MSSPKFFLFIFVFLFFLTILPSKNTVWGQSSPSGVYTATPIPACRLGYKGNASYLLRVANISPRPTTGTNEARFYLSFYGDTWNTTEKFAIKNFLGPPDFSQDQNNFGYFLGKRSNIENKGYQLDLKENSPIGAGNSPRKTMRELVNWTQTEKNAGRPKPTYSTGANLTINGVFNSNVGSSPLTLLPIETNNCPTDCFQYLEHVCIVSDGSTDKNSNISWRYKPIDIEIIDDNGKIIQADRFIFRAADNAFQWPKNGAWLQRAAQVNALAQFPLKNGGTQEKITDHLDYGRNYIFNIALNAGDNGREYEICRSSNTAPLACFEPTPTAIPPTPTAIPTGIITLNIASPPSGWGWETAVKKSDEEAPSENTQWSNQGTASSASFQIIRNSTGGSPNEYWVRLKDVSGYNRSLRVTGNRGTDYGNNPASITLTTNGVNLTASYTAIPTPTAIPPIPTATATVAPITPTATVVTPTATNIPTATNTLAPTNTVSPTATVAPITPTATVVTPTPTLTPDTCPNFAKGNATCDTGGTIDAADYSCWRANFLTARSGVTPTPALNCSRVADFNYDNKVNLFDFAIWRIGYKSSLAPTPTTNP